MRISIIGYSGAGKSSLARRLGEAYDIPVMHLDMVHWRPGWVERDDMSANQQVEALISRPDWIIEGNYMNLSFDRRMSLSNRIIMLDLPRLVCFARAMRRAGEYRGATRPDMTPGCEEKMDAEFVRWLLWEGRSAERRRQFNSVASRYPDTCVVLRSQRDIDNYVMTAVRTPMP